MTNPHEAYRHARRIIFEANERLMQARSLLTLAQRDTNNLSSAIAQVSAFAATLPEKLP